ncbi:hypothetical protein RchiOBHm_Chr1g0334671 [Rosa chinensis]|uniref:Uncharacterized protein n=1 Tax=Rosa chinensis TaxID=74649 RepID=A0A2P6SCE3_ROSCH|nr:hypothetical protein RchiOBHm_Chr1g0334671 [Rosa chinensis]
MWEVRGYCSDVILSGELGSGATLQTSTTFTEFEFAIVDLQT